MSYLPAGVLSLVKNRVLFGSRGLISVSMPCLHQSFSSIFAALFALLLWRPRGYHDNGTWLRRERSTSILIRGREAARLLLASFTSTSWNLGRRSLALLQTTTIGFQNAKESMDTPRVRLLTAAAPLMAFDNHFFFSMEHNYYNSFL